MSDSGSCTPGPAVVGGRPRPAREITPACTGNIAEALARLRYPLLVVGRPMGGDEALVMRPGAIWRVAPGSVHVVPLAASAPWEAVRELLEERDP